MHSFCAFTMLRKTTSPNLCCCRLSLSSILELQRLYCCSVAFWIIRKKALNWHQPQFPSSKALAYLRYGKYFMPKYLMVRQWITKNSRNIKRELRHLDLVAFYYFTQLLATVESHSSTDLVEEWGRNYWSINLLRAVIL